LQVNSVGQIQRLLSVIAATCHSSSNKQLGGSLGEYSHVESNAADSRIIIWISLSCIVCRAVAVRGKKKKGEMSQDAARWLGYKWVVEWLVGRGRGWAI